MLHISRRGSPRQLGPQRRNEALRADKGSGLLSIKTLFFVGGSDDSDRTSQDTVGGLMSYGVGISGHRPSESDLISVCK